MPWFLTCPQGHQWEAPVHNGAGSTDLQAVCPVCGAVILMEEEQLSSETVEHASNPAVLCLSATPVDPALVTGPDLTPEEALFSLDSAGAMLVPSTAISPAVVARAQGTGRPMVAGYEILGELGRGGMGVVYKARQVKLNRLVALKMILAGAHAGELQLERFRTEAEAVARLQHPNIVQIHEVGEQDGLPFFSLEFVDGGSLAERLAGTPMPARQAVELIAALARAMDSAHRRDIIHRDLKPANVLMTRDGTPKITDFGLAKKLDEVEGRTHTGAIMGTPSYMAPEQAEGRTHEVGPASDIYALGAILYEGLTGRPPFKSATLVDTLVQVRTQEPVAPRQLLPNLPRDLETVCLKCLNKEAARRYPTAGELADDLRRWLAGEPILARPTPAWERGWKWVRRRPGVSALIALVIAVAALGFTLVTWQWLRAETERDKAEQFAASESEAKREIQTQKDVAVKARHEADARRRDAQRTATRLLMERGVGLCQQRNYGPGLLWLARGLESASEEADDQRQSLRSLLSGWGGEVCQMKIVLRHPEPVLSADLSRDGERIVTGGQDGMARLWDAVTGRPLGQPLPHRGQVFVAAFSPDGQTILTLCGDNTARLWRTDTGAPAGELPAHPNRVLAAVFSPDGKQVLTGCKDKKARLWDLASRQLVGEPMVHNQTVVAIDFSADGKRVLTGSRDRTARLWEAATGKPAGPPLKHPKDVFAVALAPDGKTVLTGCHDPMVYLWDGLTGQPLGEPWPQQQSVSIVAFSPDGRTLLIGDDDGTVGRWDRQSRQRLGEPIRHQGKLSTALFGPGGRTILTASLDGTARLWDTAGFRPWHESRWHQESIRAALFSPDGRTILTISEDRTARLWNAATGQPRGEPMHHATTLHAAFFSPDGKTVLTRSGSAVQQWDAATGKRRGEPLFHTAVINAAVISPDGRFILTASLDETARLWQASTGQPVGQPIRHKGMATAAAFSPDSRWMLTAGADGLARLRQTEAAEQQPYLLAHGTPILAAAFSPDGKVLLTRGSNDLRLWEVATGRPIGQPLRHNNVIQAAIFSPDGKFVVTASFDKTALLVDASTGLPVGAPLQHQAAVAEPLFSPDGKLFATRSDNAVRLWKSGTAEPVGESLRHAQAIQAIAFRPDGKLLLTGSQDGAVRLWDAPTGQPLGEAFPHPEAVAALAVSPDGKTFLVGGRSGLVRLWHIPPAVEGGAEHVKQRLQVNIGLELDPSGTAVPLDAPHWLRIWQALGEPSQQAAK